MAAGVPDNAIVQRAIFTTEGQESFIAAFRDFNKILKSTQNQQKRTAKAGNDLGRSFRNILLRTTAIVGVFRTFRLIRESIEGTIRTGIQYNETIETATLSIAALITATSELVGTNGELIEGVTALDLAYSLAEDQVQKLRIAGIQTAATTQELVDAFQQAVGAGLQTGLTLDEIRNVTIRLTQAAGALGVPYRQLNEEIRSILSGVIDQNTRIAKALGITNDQVKAAKEQGQLYQFLNQQFEAFGIAGDRILTTFAALRSTVKETVELIAGDLVKPLFDALRFEGLGQLERIFDFDTAQISDEFKGLISNVQLLFFEVGDLATDAIEGFLDGIQRISSESENASSFWFSIGNSLTRIVRSVGDFFSTTASLLRPLGGIQGILESVADTMETIANNAGLVLITLTAIGGLTLGAIVAILGALAAKIAIVAVALGGLIALIDKYTTSEAELIRADREALTIERQKSTEYRGQTKTLGFLVKEYDKYVQRLDAAVEGSEDYLEAQSRILGIEQQLRTLGFGDFLERANGDRKEAVRLLREELYERRRILAARLDAIRAEAGALQERVDQQQFLIDEGKAETPQFRETKQYLDDLIKFRDEIERELIEIDRIISSGSFDLFPKAEDGEDQDEALKRLRANIQAELAAIRRTLDEETAKLDAKRERQQISLAQYYSDLGKLQETFTNDSIAALERLAAAEEEEERKTQARSRQEDLRSRRRIQIIENELALQQALDKLQKDLQEGQIEFYDAIGNKAEATRIKIEREFGELIRRLEVEGDFVGAAILRDLRNIRLAQAEFDAIETGIQRVQAQVQARLQEINQLRDIGVLTDLQAQRESAEAYKQLEAALAAVERRLRQLADTAADPEVRQAAQVLLDLLGQTRTTIRGLSDDWLKLESTFRTSLEDELGDLLANAVIEAENLGDAFRNLAAGVRPALAAIAAEITRLLARMIALRIVTAAFGGATGGQASASGFDLGNIQNYDTLGTGAKAGGYVQRYARGGRVQRFPKGGKVRGPGGPTADKVPAMLSAGEYVVKAASVKKYGADFLHALNAGVLPRKLRGYRDGGLVGSVAADTPNASPGARESDSLKGELTVGLADGLVVNNMDTPSGRRLILKVISQNPRGVRKSLGL